MIYDTLGEQIMAGHYVNGNNECYINTNYSSFNAWAVGPEQARLWT